MDKQPKRRVLSLSLSQPAKPSRRLKLKRHASATSENESKALPCEGQQEVNNTRDSVELNVSEDRHNLIAPVTSDQLVTKHHFSDTDESSSLPPITIPWEQKSLDSGNKESEDCLEGKCVPTDSTEETIKTRRIKKEPVPSNVRGRLASSEDDDSDFVKPPCRRKKAEKVPLKDSSCDSQANATSGKRLNENVEIESSSTSSRSSCSSPGIRKTTPPEDKGTPVAQSRTSTCVTPPPKDESGQDKPSETVSDDECFEVLQCPLCGKIFEKLSSKTSHLKSCASKHKVSTQQLLEALELQRRQALERRALGLPAISPSVEKIKKSTTSKKESRATSKLDNNLKMDSNLQLALALSLSLQDNEKHAEQPSTSESTRGISLDHFGFTSKSVLDSVQPRPAPAPLPKGKSKGMAKRTPALLTRTAEERQRIITEKVAMILMEEVASGEDKGSKEINVQSTFLQECVDVERALWAKSHTSPSKNDRTSYYVKNLRSFISPSKVEMGSKVMHLSQVVGRFNTPNKDKKQQEVEKEDLVKEDFILNSPSEEEDSSDASCQELQDSTHIEMELRAKLFNDWASMVNNTTMSDLTIYPQEGRDIPAHKMVLHVRCPRILKDICRQRNPLTGNEVEVIMWSKTPHAAALAFLEYIYCGSVKSIRVLSEDLSSISWLADHYKVGDLTRYLKSITESSQTTSQVALNVVKDFNEDCQKQASETEKEISVPTLNENVALRSLSRLSSDMFASPVGTPTRSETNSIYSEATVQGADNASSCSSPDMFCEDEGGQETANVEDGRHSMETAMESESVISNVTKNLSKNLFGIDVEDDRPPSLCPSVSSEQTVIVTRTSPPISRRTSASSDNTVVICNDSEPPSPALSNSSAVTELLDFNQSGTATSRPGSSLNDSKRKHSNSSQDGDSSLCKRMCPAGSTLGHQSEKEDSDIEFCDLTQDSDSSTSFPVIPNQFSGNSGDKISISSENESDTNFKSPELAKRVSNVEKNHSDGKNKSSELKEHDSEKEEVETATNAYVSPVWEGFEDLNYDDPFFDEPHVDLGSPQTNVSPPKTVRDECPSTNSDISLISENKTPVKIGTSSEKKCDDSFDDDSSKSSPDCEVTYTSPASSAMSKQSKPSNSGFDALLDDSLNINDSLLLQAEKIMPAKLTQRETKGTPVNRILASEADGVTPLANYSAMKTPELKKELQKYGLKPTLGKRKGKIMLRHIYNELHPWVPIETNPSLPDRMSLSQPSCSSSLEKKISSEPNSRRLSFSDSDTVEKNTTPFDKDSRDSLTDSDSDSNCSSRSGGTSRQEIQYLEGDGDENEDDCEPKSQATSKRVNKSDLPRIVSNFIRNDKELHHKILEYEPIWIEKLQADLLANGFKCGIEALMAFLDEKCITFRSEPSGPRVRKKKLKSTAVKKTARNTDTNTHDSD